MSMNEELFNREVKFMSNPLNYEKSLAIYHAHKQKIKKGECYGNVLRLVDIVNMDVVYGYIEHHMFKKNVQNMDVEHTVVYRHCLFKDGEELICPSIVNATNMTKEIFESLRVIPIAVIPKEQYWEFIDDFCVVEGSNDMFDISQNFAHEKLLIKEMRLKKIFPLIK